MARLMGCSRYLQIPSICILAQHLEMPPDYDRDHFFNAWSGEENARAWISFLQALLAYDLPTNHFFFVSVNPCDGMIKPIHPLQISLWRENGIEKVSLGFLSGASPTDFLFSSVCSSFNESQNDPKFWVKWLTEALAKVNFSTVF